MAPKSESANGVMEHKARANSSKRMKQIFVGKVFSFSGNFGNNWGHDQMASWIKAHGGRYEREVSDDTTHLICTMGDYALKTDQGKSRLRPPSNLELIVHIVKKAKALGNQCHILTKDWLEDCLIGHPTKKRCRAEGPYTLKRVFKRVGAAKDKQHEYRQKFEDGVNASYELVDNRKLSWDVGHGPLLNSTSGLSHIYYDETGFEYKIVCTRIKSDGKVKSEKYILYVRSSAWQLLTVKFTC
jgi:hypothetical protein